MSGEKRPVTFQKIIQANNYTAFILEADHKRFAIYAAPQTGSAIQATLKEKGDIRPSTYDLMSFLMQGFGIRPLQVVLEKVEDTTYFAKLFLEKDFGESKEILEIDSRPSDCLTLAIKKQIPVFCSDEVIAKSPEFLA